MVLIDHGLTCGDTLTLVDEESCELVELGNGTSIDVACVVARRLIRRKMIDCGDGKSPCNEPDERREAPCCSEDVGTHEQ